jgi:hypothetical protein
MMEIVPLKGIGQIKFGMNPQSVRGLFNSNETYEGWMGGNCNDSIMYPGIKFVFNRFDAYGPLPRSDLWMIVVHGRTDISLWGLPINQWTKPKVQDYLQQESLSFSINPLGEIEIENLGLNLYFDKGESLNEILYEWIKEKPWWKFK